MNKISFIGGFNGTFIKKSQEIKINNDTFKPYDLLLVGLASCFYSTFLDVCRQADIEIFNCDVNVDYEKREESPKTLKIILINFKIDTNVDKFKIMNLLKIAYGNCSMIETIGKSVDIKYDAIVKNRFSIYLK